jgi:hypothetical protein
MWALHNLDTYLNLCRLHPKYKELEAAHRAKGGTTEMTANDIKINTALKAIEDSDDDASVDCHSLDGHTTRWTWPIILWGLAGSEPTTTMSALMLMPLIIEMMVSGKDVHFLMRACLLWIHMAVLDGGIPTIVHAGVAATIPASVPPNPPSYSTKRHRRETNDSWWGHLTGRVRALTDTVFNRVGAVTRLSPRGTSNNEPPTSTYMPARRRRRHVLMNKRLAKTLKLVSITCMAASAFEGTTAFDSDSKQVAIDNCSSRSLTTSRKDFVPGMIRKCNVAVSGVGGQIRCKIKGTVCWTFEDDQGRPHDFLLPNTPMCEGLNPPTTVPTTLGTRGGKGDQITAARGATTRVHN